MTNQQSIESVSWLITEDQIFHAADSAMAIHQLLLEIANFPTPTGDEKIKRLSPKLNALMAELNQRVGELPYSNCSQQ